MKPVRKIRSTRHQIEYLCKYMHEHKDFASAVGHYRMSDGIEGTDPQWMELKSELNKLGPARSLHQWKICWRDQKRKARLENDVKDKNGSIARATTRALILDTIRTEPIEFVQLSPALIEAQPGTRTSSPSPSSPPRTPSPNVEIRQPQRPRRRFRSSQLPVRSLKAQLELNGLLRDLNKELRRSNTLKAEQNYLLRKLWRKNK